MKYDFELHPDLPIEEGTYVTEEEYNRMLKRVGLEPVTKAVKPSEPVKLVLPVKADSEAKSSDKN